jgi:hypothetical protein
MSPALALLLLACSPDPVEEQGPPPEAPPSFVVQQTPPPAPTPPLASPAAGVPPEAVSVVFGLGAPGGGLISDVGAQRVRLTDGQPLWAADHVVVVSGSAYHERRPAVVPDQAGGFVAVYEAEVPEGPLKGDIDLLAQRVDGSGALRWGGGTQSVVIAATSVVERAPALVPTGDGGAFVVFERHGTDDSGAIDSDLGAQRIGPDGSLRWASGAMEGLSIAAGPGLATAPVAVPDGQGGLIVVFELEPVGGPGAGTTLLCAHRIDPQGVPLWSQDGQPLVIARAQGSVGQPAVLPDGLGGAMVIFREEQRTGELAGDHDLMVQRVLADGSLPWSGQPEDYKIVSATILDEGAPAAVLDQQGGAIVAYQATWREGPRKGQVDLFAQRIDAEGAGLWNDGAPVPLSTSDGDEGPPRLVSDGAGGAIAIYEHAPPAAHLSQDRDLHAQRIGPDGSLRWFGGQRSAILSATTHLERQPSAVPDGAGGVVAFFEAVALSGEHEGDSELVAQRLDPAGERLWGADGTPAKIAWSAALERNPVVVGD